MRGYRSAPSENEVRARVTARDPHWVKPMSGNETHPQKNSGARQDEPTAKLQAALGITNQALELIDADEPGHAAAVDALQNLEVAAERRKDELEDR